MCQNSSVPKIVDHNARRSEIAAALRRVIVRKGVAGASVRAVAAEAGWSMGALRHYFATQEELLRYGVEMQLQQVPERLGEVVARLGPGPARAQALLEELLPLDEQRLSEALVWLAALGQARVDRSLDDLRRLGFDGERRIARAAIADVFAQPWPESGDFFVEPLAPQLEAEAAKLQVLVDGLTLQGATYPETVDAQVISTILTDHLRGLAR